MHEPEKTYRIDDDVKRRRLELGEFLRQRRGTLKPDEIGVASTGRRHVRGLRRDEVAEAASIGVSWYAMLEQGRAENVTRETLEAIADVLKLSAPERQYLQGLAGSTFVRGSHDPRLPSPALLEFVRTFEGGGAFIHGSNCDVVAWNGYADAYFRFSHHGPSPNMLRVMLQEPLLGQVFVQPDWNEIFKRMIGNFRRFRANYGDATHDALVDELLGHHDFAEQWRQSPVIPPPAELGVIDHPALGRQYVSVVALSSPACPTYQVVLTLTKDHQHQLTGPGHGVEQRIYDASLGNETIRRRREELGGFLRSRRARLTPEEIGLVSKTRRHVKGLRREEVASAAGIGTSWYALLEQGRVDNVSAKTLEGIAEALRLSVRERLYVKSLAARSFAELFDLHAPPMPALIDFVRDYPRGHVHMHDGCFEMTAYNAEADALYGFTRTGHTNLLELMILSPDVRRAFVSPTWDQTLGHMLGHFRFTYSRFGDERYDALIERLTSASPEFAALWNDQLDVLEPGPMNASFRFSDGSIQERRFFALIPSASPDFTLIFKLPVT